MRARKNSFWGGRKRGVKTHSQKQRHHIAVVRGLQEVAVRGGRGRKQPKTSEPAVSWTPRTRPPPPDLFLIGSPSMIFYRISLILSPHEIRIRPQINYVPVSHLSHAKIENLEVSMCRGRRTGQLDAAHCGCSSFASLHPTTDRGSFSVWN